MAWRKSPKRIQKTNFAFFHNFTLVNTTTGPPSIPHPPKKASHFTHPTSSKRPRTSSKATVEVAEWTPKTEGQCNFGQPLGGGKHRICRWKTDGWVGSQKKCGISTSTPTRKSFSLKFWELQFFFLFLSFPTSAELFWEPFHVSDSMPRGLRTREFKLTKIVMCC